MVDIASITICIKNKYKGNSENYNHIEIH